MQPRALAVLELLLERPGRSHFGDGGDDAGAAAHLPRHVARRAVAGVGSRVHPRFHTPHISTLVTGVAVAAVAGLTPIGTLGGLVSIGTLMAFVIVSIGVVVQRRTRPDRPRPFRMPLVPFLPILSAVVSLVLMLGLPRETWERLIIWMVLGVGVVFFVRVPEESPEQREQDPSCGLVTHGLRYGSPFFLP